jgi:hypothetical protein
MKFGVTLANRGVLFGLTTVPKLFALADAEACPVGHRLGRRRAVRQPAARRAHIPGRHRRAHQDQSLPSDRVPGLTFRLAPMGDATAQLRRLIEEVPPLVSGQVVG